jgi:hypothetical protein
LPPKREDKQTRSARYGSIRQYVVYFSKNKEKENKAYLQIPKIIA